MKNIRILYGIQGTGNGHTTRARALLPALQRAGATVDCLFSGRAPELYFDMEPFGNYRTFNGLSFATANGRVQIWRSWQQSRARQFLHDVQTLDVSSYDLILTDFEPISAWAAKIRGKPCIAIGHQYAFDYPIPQQRGDLLTRLVMRHYAPASIRAGFHWHHFQQPILPPLLEHHTPLADNGQVLVYLPFEDGQQILAALAPLTDYRFKVFHTHQPANLPAHIQWHKPQRQLFVEVLRGCRLVIANAGFELGSEALQLGRPLLVKPLAGQTEQASNVVALEHLKLGRGFHTLDADTLARSLQRMPAKPQVQFPDIANALAHWICDPERSSLKAFSQQLWCPAVPSLRHALLNDLAQPHRAFRQQPQGS